MYNHIGEIMLSSFFTVGKTLTVDDMEELINASKGV
jgi:hypothetical protein